MNLLKRLFRNRQSARDELEAQKVLLRRAWRENMELRLNRSGLQPHMVDGLRQQKSKDLDDMDDIIKRQRAQIDALERLIKVRRWRRWDQ